MKIAIIGSRGIPASYSGVEKSIEESVKRLSLKEREFIVYCHSGKPLTADQKKNLFAHTLLVETPTLENKYLATFIASFLATFDALFRKADIVHYHCLGPSVFAFLPRLCGKKVAVTIHALDWRRRKWPFFAKFFLWACQFCALYFAHKTIVISQTMAKKFRPKVIYIPHGVNFPERAPQEPEKFILFSGRISQEKGLDCLLKAFNSLKNDFQLVIAGEAVYEKRYLNYLKSIAKENTVFAGWLDSRALASFYSRAYAVVFPAEMDGCYLALLEAASFARCIVASDIPEFREVLGETGVYFTKGNYLELKKQLEYLIAHPEEVAQRGAELKKIAAGYNWDDIVKSLAGVYDGLSASG